MAASDDAGGVATRAIVRRTQVLDLARAVPLGVLLPLEQSVLLTVAIKRFEAPALVKGVVAAAAGVGMLASPFATAFARRRGQPVLALAAALSGVGALGFAAAAIGSLALFVVGAVVGIATVYATIPLMTLTYERNFPAVERGKRVGWGMAVKVGAAALAGVAIGGVLKAHLGWWRWVMVGGAVASAAMVAIYRGIPSAPLARLEGRNDRVWPHFHLLAEDRRLRMTLSAWMLMGFGNLMLLPLRVEYLANDRYGIGADAAKITLLIVTVPAIVRLVSMPVFGVVFDRLSFFAARIVVNLLFALYVGAFFTGTNDVGLFAGAVALGIGSAGGDLMWNLWVTKFAPPGRVADYMGLHTFFTGVRASFAPLIGFAVVARLPLLTVAFIAAGLMLTSSAMLLPEARLERRLRARGAAPAAADGAVEAATL